MLPSKPALTHGRHLWLLGFVQVLHLCVTVASNQDTAFGAVVIWSAMQLLFSSFFINFGQVSPCKGKCGLG